MNDNTYKKIADELKKEKGFEILIDSANEDEKYLFECCNGNIKLYKDLINKALDDWSNEKEKKINDFDIKELYCSKIRCEIFPFVILMD